MKRSAQVALVLMGVGGVTAAGAYMMPARSADCRAPNPQQQQTALPVGPMIGGEAPKARVAGQAELQSSSLDAQFEELEADTTQLEIEARLAELKGQLGGTPSGEVEGSPEQTTP